MRLFFLSVWALMFSLLSMSAQTPESADSVGRRISTYWMTPVVEGYEANLLNRYQFSDNWFYGIHVGANLNWGSNQKHVSLDGGVRPSAAFSFGKWLSPYVVLRGMLAYENNRGVTSAPYQTFLWESAMLHFDGLFSLTNILRGYRESRPFNFLVFLGVGGEQTFGFSHPDWNVGEKRFHRGPCSLFNVHVGVESLFRLSECWDLSVDLLNSWIDDSYDGVITTNRYDGHVNLWVGLIRRLGNHDGTHQFTFIKRDPSKFEEANREINRLRQATELARLNMPVVMIESEQVNVLVSFQEHSSQIDKMQEVNVFTAVQHMRKSGNAINLYITVLDSHPADEALFYERAETIRRSLVNDYGIPQERVIIEKERSKVETVYKAENCVIVSINESTK